MSREDVAQWLSDYIEAWKSYDPEAIGALFSDDIRYRYHPYDEPIEGRQAVVESWLGEGEHEDASARDAPGTYEASYEPVAVDGRRRGGNRHQHLCKEPGGPVDIVYDNCFVMRFDDEGRCREFTEWFMKRPDA